MRSLRAFTLTAAAPSFRRGGWRAVCGAAAARVHKPEGLDLFR